MDFGDATEPGLREQVARALVYKGSRLGQLNRSEEELAVYDQVDQRFGDATESGLREQVARALVFKGITLGELKRTSEACAICQEVEHRFADLEGKASDGGPCLFLAS